MAVFSQTDHHRKTDYVKLARAFGFCSVLLPAIAELRDLRCTEAVKRTDLPCCNRRTQIVKVSKHVTATMIPA